MIMLTRLRKVVGAENGWMDGIKEVESYRLLPKSGQDVELFAYMLPGDKLASITPGPFK